MSHSKPSFWRRLGLGLGTVPGTADERRVFLQKRVSLYLGGLSLLWILIAPLTPELEALVLACLAKERDARPPSAHADTVPVDVQGRGDRWAHPRRLELEKDA